MPRPDCENHSIALVVDDNPDSLGMVSAALEDNGITVMVARNGRTALDLAARVEPDVILMDAVMPQMDGFETCRQLKSGDRIVHAPVIFMTGLTEPEHIVKGLKSGGVDYITKPVIIDELLARITIHMINARMIRSAREALDTSGRSVIAVDGAGTLLWGSPRALVAVGTGKCASSLLFAQEPEFPVWLQHCLSVPASKSSPFSFKSCALSFVGTSASGEILLKLTTPRDSSPPEYLAQIFALTPREGEVLYWLSMGKTNRDIAQILTLSSRTVNKHLEQIFQKMGVDNRTSAAVLADRMLYEN